MMRLVSLKWAPHLCCARTTRAAEPWEDKSRKLEHSPGPLRTWGLAGLCFPGHCSRGDVNAYCLQYLYKVLCD